MHFVYILDHLFQSTRVSDENSSVSKAFHFSKLISTQEFFCARTGCTSCTNWTISVKVQGFLTKTRLFQRRIIFLSLFQLKTSFASNLQHSKSHTKISTLSDVIC